MKRATLLTAVAGAVAGLFTTMAPFATNAFAAAEPAWSGASDGPVYLLDAGDNNQYVKGSQLDWDAPLAVVVSSATTATRLPFVAGSLTETPFLSAVGDERIPDNWKLSSDVVNLNGKGAFIPNVTPSAFTVGSQSAVTSAGGTYSLGVAYRDTLTHVTAAYYTTINVDAGAGTWKFATPVVAKTTTTVLTADQTSLDVGGTVALTATVTTEDSSAAAGSVEFFDGSTSLGSATVSGGTATKTVTVASGGTHPYKAIFTPTSSAYASSTSSVVSVSAAKLASTTAIAANATSVAASGSVKLTATVTPTAATGSVQFYDGTAAVGSPVALAAGAASATVTVKPGTHSYTAKYTGSSTYAESTSKPVSVTAAAPKKFTKTVKPTISGSARVGKKLTAKVKAWSPKATFSYQWYANGKSIKGATHSTWKLAKAQKGKKITVKVTGSRVGYTKVTLASKATAKVK